MLQGHKVGVKRGPARPCAARFRRRAGPVVDHVGGPGVDVGARDALPRLHFPVAEIGTARRASQIKPSSALARSGSVARGLRTARRRPARRSITPPPRRTVRSVTARSVRYNVVPPAGWVAGASSYKSAPGNGRRRQTHQIAASLTHATRQTVARTSRRCVARISTPARRQHRRAARQAMFSSGYRTGVAGASGGERRHQFRPALYRASGRARHSRLITHVVQTPDQRAGGKPRQGPGL
jgi:hypothetical protein